MNKDVEIHFTKLEDSIRFPNCAKNRYVGNPSIFKMLDLRTFFKPQKTNPTHISTLDQDVYSGSPGNFTGRRGSRLQSLHFSYF